MSSELESLKRYFEQNLETLSENYPGLKWERLKRDFLDSKLKLDFWVNSLDQKKPLEYITQTSFFYTSEFFVNENVLIPRSETEVLVERAIHFLKSKKNQTVIDIGTGSGCIILSILKELPKAKAMAGDISRKALDIAKKNAESLNLSNIVFQESDRFQNIKGKFQLIVSNPPYGRKKEHFETFHPQVRAYEPHLALFLEDEIYIQWFKDFFQQVYDHLEDDGLFIMEGHEDEVEGLQRYLREVGFENVTVVKDYTQRNRFIEAKKNG